MLPLEHARYRSIFQQYATRPLAVLGFAVSGVTMLEILVLFTAYLTCPTSIEALFFRLLQGVYTTSTLFNLLPVMELALTS